MKGHLFSFFIFVLTILILIGVHEAGHFLAAKLMQVKVLKFSLGFGKPLLLWRGKQGTEYALAWLPLGGYVKLLNTREDSAITAEEYPYALDHQAIWRRVVIVLAGPVVNLLFAILAFYLVYSVGITTIKPVIHDVIPHSLAAQAGLKPGLEITKIQGKRVYDWGDVSLRLALALGDTGALAIEAQPFFSQSQKARTQSYILHRDQWTLNALKPDLLKSIGLEPYYPKDSDQVKIKEESQDIHFARQYPVYYALIPALEDTFLFLQLNTVTLGKIFTGKLSFQTLGGPLLVYSVADLAFQQGFLIYIKFLGILSVMLTFVNMLPIPGLDGSHLLYFVIEKIRGRPISVRLETLLIRLGMIVLILLMVHVTINDLMRFFQE